MADLDDTNNFSEEELSADSDAPAEDEDSDEDALVEADEIVDEDEDGDGDGDDDEDIDGLLTSLAADERPGDARRRIEDYLEMKRAARELSDLDAYVFD